MNVLKQIGLLFGWLSGSLAGIGIFFYCFGYLITAADLHLLGLDVFIFSYKPSFYVSRGVIFFGYQLVVLSELLFALAPLLLLALLGGGFYTLGRRWIGRSRAGKRRLVRCRRALTRLSGHRRLRTTAITLLLLVFLFYLSAILGSITQPLQVSGLLHGLQRQGCEPGNAPQTAPGSMAVRIACWLQTGDTDALRARFHEAVLAEAFAIGCLVMAWYAVARLGVSRLILAPFVLAAAVIVTLLPLIYGVLMLPRDFPSIRLLARDQTAMHHLEHLYLLNKTDSDFVLWEAAKRKVVWVPLSALTAAEIGRSHTLHEIITALEAKP